MDKYSLGSCFFEMSLSISTSAGLPIVNNHLFCCSQLDTSLPSPHTVRKNSKYLSLNENLLMGWRDLDRSSLHIFTNRVYEYITFIPPHLRINLISFVQSIISKTENSPKLAPVWQHWGNKSNRLSKMKCDKNC